MTLAQAAMQTPVKIVGFTELGERDLGRLESLGLRAGAEVTKLLHTPLRDPIECLVGPQLLAVESWLLERIVVESPSRHP